MAFKPSLSAEFGAAFRALTDDMSKQVRNAVRLILADGPLSLETAQDLGVKIGKVSSSFDPKAWTVEFPAPIYNDVRRMAYMVEHEALAPGANGVAYFVLLGNLQSTTNAVILNEGYKILDRLKKGGPK